MDKNTKNRIKKIEEQRRIRDLESSTFRARSVSVGTAFGGTTEISMRGDAGQSLWCIMQPVEVIELIHQLASNVGCHLALKPREDFSAWRNWKPDATMISGNNWPPFVNDMSPHNQIGTSQSTQADVLLPPDNKEQIVSGVSPALKTQKTKNRSKDNAVATKKNIN